MKSYIFSFLIGAALFSYANLHAQDDAGAVDPEHKAAADKLLRTLNIDENMKMAFRQMERMQEQMIARDAKSPEEKAKAETAMKAAMRSTEEEFSWDKIGPMFVDVYAEVFTKEELEQLTNFYESPIGQKFVEKQPQLQVATMKRMQALMKEIMPKIQSRVKTAMEEADGETDTAAPAKEE